MRISDWNSDVCSSDLCWAPPFFFGRPKSFTGTAVGTKGRASELTAQDHVQLRQQGSQPMRSLTALAVVLAAATVSVPAALAQDTAPSTSDPSAGAQQPMPGAAGSGAGQDGSTTMPDTGAPR